MKHQKGFISIPILIVIIVSIVAVSVVTTGVVLYKQGKLVRLIASVSQVFKGAEDVEEVSQQEQELEQARLEAEKVRQEAEAAKAEAEQLRAEQEEAQRIAELEQRIKELEGQTEKESESAILQMQQETQQWIQEFEQKIKELEEETPHPSIPDLSLIISQWSPIIVPIQCEFRYSDTNQVYQLLGGSGVVIVSDTLSYILTNEHIVTDDEGYGAYSCDIKLSSGTFTISNKDFRFSLSDSLDLAIINITNPNQHIKSLIHKFYPLCRKQPAIGDEVVILGYPSIGSQSTITATEGIISGYDGDYFITSAKIEQGNSGGAAILLEENCLLGIPTFVRVGQIESLARILNINVVLD